MFDNYDPFREASRYRKQLDEQIEKLRTDQPCRVPNVGDRVVVAGGPLGLGHGWIRYEGVVTEVASTAYKVRLVDYAPTDGKPWERWVVPEIITDVLGPRTTEEE